jgi:hypothetical protein
VGKEKYNGATLYAGKDTIHSQVVPGLIINIK